MTKPKAAFICVHNSCRSQMAEALSKLLAKDSYEAYSAGTETKPQINQDAVAVIVSVKQRDGSLASLKEMKMNNNSYRKATLDDIQATTEIALLLFDEHTFDEIFEDYSKQLTKDSVAIFLAFDGNKTIGFSHCSLRYDYVEGTHGGTIGYLEGIYVLPEYRKQGVAKSLVALCEKWARDKGCSEFASDCQLNNADSYSFHIRIGFEEANRMICFVKNLKL